MAMDMVFLIFNGVLRTLPLLPLRNVDVVLTIVVSDILIVVVFDTIPMMTACLCLVINDIVVHVLVIHTSSPRFWRC